MNGARDLRIMVTGEDDIVLRARVVGRESAPAVLLLHGLGEDLGTFWERGWVDALVPHYRVVAFDARGHGASSKPHQAARYGDEARVADALAVLDATSARSAHVLGYSMGAWTAFLLAGAAPDRVRSVVAGGAAVGGQSLEPLRRLLAAGMPALRAVVEREHGPLSDAVASRLLGNDPAALAAVCATDRPDLSSALRGFTNSVLIYVGEHDPLRPLVQQGARALGWPCVVLQGVGHFEAALESAALPLIVDHLRALDLSHHHPSNSAAVTT